MDNVTGFGVQNEEFNGHSMEQLDDLNKALTAGHEYAEQLPQQMTGGAVHQYESLDKTLRLVSYEMKNLKFWPDVPKDQAYNTVEEYDVQNSYGNNGTPFFNMGDAPAAKDAGYSRHVAKVKYVGTQRQVHHNLTLVRAAHGPVIAREVKNGTMYILGEQERFLFEAAEGTNALEYDGIFGQIAAGDTNSKFQAQAFEGYNTTNSVVFDLRGDILDEDNMEIIALTVLNNFGYPTDMYLDTKAHSDFSRSFFPKQRIAAPGEKVRGGITIPDFQSSAGIFNLKSTVFRRPRRGYLTAANNPNAPATPVISVQPVRSADALSQFGAGDVGDYFYQVAAFNEYGESAAVASNKVTVQAGDKVQLTVADLAGAYGFLVFRTNAGAASAVTAEFIKRVAKGATVTVITDYNDDLPGLSKAALMKMDLDNVCFKQLAPLMKMDLAVTGTSFRWMQLHYGMPMVFTPRFNVYVKNIGRAR